MKTASVPTITVETKQFMRDVKLPDGSATWKLLMAGAYPFLVVVWINGQAVNIDSGHEDAREANRHAALLSVWLEEAIFKIKLSALTSAQRTGLATAVDGMDICKRSYANAVHMRKQTRNALYRLGMLHGIGPLARLTPSGIAAGRAAIADRDSALAKRDAR